MDKSLNKQSHTRPIKSANNDRSQKRKRQTEKMSKGNKSKISYLWKTVNVGFVFVLRFLYNGKKEMIILFIITFHDRST